MLEFSEPVKVGEAEEWFETGGKKGRKATVLTVKHETSVINKLFGGQMRSEYKAKGKVMVIK